MKPVAALLVALALAGSAQASDHYALIRNSDRENHPVVTLEVAALDQTPVNVTVLGGAGGCGSATLSLEPANDFFASADLVAMGNGLELDQAKLARCTSVVPVSSSVVLRGDQGEVVVPPTEDSLGARFVFPIGDLGKGVALLLGNPNQGEIEVGIEVGSAAAQRVTVPGLGVLAVPLGVASRRHTATSVGPGGSQPLFIAAVVYSEKGRSSRMVVLNPGF
jgi:hypothetical protein